MRRIAVDSSAIVALTLHEPGMQWIGSQLRDADIRLMAAPTRVELGMVLESRLAPPDMAAAVKLLHRADLEIVPFTSELAEGALAAWRLYGQGRHPAALNFGDCFSYALADLFGCPLLCTGNDFARTPLPILTPPPGARGPGSR